MGENLLSIVITLFGLKFQQKREKYVEI